MNRKFFLYLAPVLTNFWIWIILKENVLLFVLLIVISVSLTTIIIEGREENGVLSLLTVSFVCAGFLVILGHADRKLFPNPMTYYPMLSDRHGFLANELGGFFKNKFILNFYVQLYPYIGRWQQNMSYVLDPNLYFFSAHPRERQVVNEFSKYPSLFLPFFVIGAIRLIRRSSRVLTIYLTFSILISAIIDPYFILGPVLLFPVVNTSIVAGTLAILQSFRQKSNLCKEQF